MFERYKNAFFKIVLNCKDSIRGTVCTPNYRAFSAQVKSDVSKPETSSYQVNKRPGLLNKANKKLNQFLEEFSYYKSIKNEKTGKFVDVLDLDNPQVRHPKNDDGFLEARNKGIVFFKLNMDTYVQINKVFESALNGFQDKPNITSALSSTLKDCEFILLGSSLNSLVGDDFNSNVLLAIPKSNTVALQRARMMADIFEKIEMDGNFTIDTLTNFLVCYSEVPVPLSERFKSIFKKFTANIEPTPENLSLQESILKNFKIIRDDRVKLGTFVGEGFGDVNTYTNTARAGHVGDNFSILNTIPNQTGYDRVEISENKKFIENALSRPPYVSVFPNNQNMEVFFPYFMGASDGVLAARKDGDFVFITHKAACFHAAKQHVETVVRKNSQIKKAVIDDEKAIRQVQVDASINPNAEYLDTPLGREYVSKLLKASGFKPPVYVDGLGWRVKHSDTNISSILIVKKPQSDIQSTFGLIDSWTDNKSVDSNQNEVTNKKPFDSGVADD